MTWLVSRADLRARSSIWVLFRRQRGDLCVKEYFRPYGSQVEILRCGTERNEWCDAAAVSRQESNWEFGDN